MHDTSVVTSLSNNYGTLAILYTPAGDRKRAAAQPAQAEQQCTELHAEFGYPLVYVAGSKKGGGGLIARSNIRRGTIICHLRGPTVPSCTHTRYAIRVGSMTRDGSDSTKARLLLSDGSKVDISGWGEREWSAVTPGRPEYTRKFGVAWVGNSGLWRFINESRVRGESNVSWKHGKVQAVRDIAHGEELLVFTYGSSYKRDYNPAV